MQYTNAWHLFTILIEFQHLKIKKRDIIKKLEEKGIGTQVHYIPILCNPTINIVITLSLKVVTYYKRI